MVTHLPHPPPTAACPPGGPSLTREGTETTTPNREQAGPGAGPGAGAVVSSRAAPGGADSGSEGPVVSDVAPPPLRREVGGTGAQTSRCGHVQTAVFPRGTKCYFSFDFSPNHLKM